MKLFLKLLSFITILSTSLFSLNVQGGCPLGSWQLQGNLYKCSTQGAQSPILGIEHSSYSVQEGNTITPKVIRSGDLTETLSVGIIAGVFQGDSGQGNDFISPGYKTLSWNAGEGGSKSYGPISIVDDTIQENIESFSIFLSNPPAGVTVTNARASVNIDASDSNGGGGGGGNVPPPGGTTICETENLNLKTIDFSNLVSNHLRDTSMRKGDVFSIHFKTLDSGRIMRAGLVEFAIQGQVDVDNRTMVVSKTSCDFSLSGDNYPVIAPRPNLIVPIGTINNPRLLGRLEPNTDYYINIINRDMQNNPNIDLCFDGSICGFDISFDQLPE